MLKEYMEGMKPSQLSKSFRMDAKKVYKCVEQFKIFMETVIRKEDGDMKQLH